MSATHRLDTVLLTKTIDVHVVGCGGTGSVIAGWLPFLHQTLLALGHPHGLRVTLIDGDTVSETNCVRQAFSRGDVGRNKAEILVERVNLFFGLGWSAMPRYLKDSDKLDADLVIGCVDTRAARHTLMRVCAASFAVRYWLDLGNNAYDGQFVLGQPQHFEKRYTSKDGWRQVSTLDEDTRLPTVADLYPATVDITQPDDAPACSTVEALSRQGAFVNQAIASHACVMLGRLFRFGELTHHGEFINFESGRSFPIPVPAKREPNVQSV